MSEDAKPRQVWSVKRGLLVHLASALVAGAIGLAIGWLVCRPAGSQDVLPFFCLTACATMLAFPCALLVSRLAFGGLSSFWSLRAGIPALIVFLLFQLRHGSLQESLARSLDPVASHVVTVVLSVLIPVACGLSVYVIALPPHFWRQAGCADTGPSQGAQE